MIFFLQLFKAFDSINAKESDFHAPNLKFCRSNVAA